MMKKYIFHIFLMVFLFSGQSFSQRLFVVPYYPDMYNNGAAKQIIAETNIDYNKLNTIISQALLRHIQQAFPDSVVTIVHSNASTTTADFHPIESIWSLLDYTMAPLPNKSYVLIGAQSKLSNRKISQKRTGELRPVIRSTTHSFLDAKITDKRTFSKIAHRLKCDYILVINEFDIKVDYSDPYATGRNDNKRQIQVHYSLFDKTGKHIAGNVSAVNFSSRENNIHNIIYTYFNKLAQQIVDYLKF